MPDDSRKKSSHAEREERVLKFWRENDIFNKSFLQKAPQGEFVFYEGPPTANGKPGIHHLEARAFKDALPRYKTMRGYHVRRKAGWDTHGLPVELEVEKELGISSKKEIEEYGIAAFNEKCRQSVTTYLKQWHEFTHRVGFWLNHSEAYFTYENNYIETLWWVLAQVEKKGLLYKDYKVVPWCPRCGTGLSSHELAQGYADVKDISVYAKFELVDEPGTFMLAWTTTPWTLPGNVALAVGKDISYVKVKTGDDTLILAKDRTSVLPDDFEIIEEYKGKDLVGRTYKPLYPFVRDGVTGEEKQKLENAFAIHAADFVTTEEGTGIVHTAVMYGQDDFELGTKVGLPKHHVVSQSGHFITGTDFLEGAFVKDEDTAVSIIKDLAHRGLLFAKEKFEHSYPHCWRCKTPLIYYARDSWYIRMSELRDELVAENKHINWEPSYIKEGRFGQWLQEVKDWAISRERYWGTPLPVWECDSCEKRTVIGSVEQLEQSAQTSGNTYLLMRHGHAESNKAGIITGGAADVTVRGKEEVVKAAERLKAEGAPDLVLVSPVPRAQQTARIVSEELNIPKENIQTEERIREFDFGEFEGKTIDEYHTFMKKEPGFMSRKVPGGESHEDVRNRMMETIGELEEKYKDKRILLITHGSPSWMLMSAAECLTETEAMARTKESQVNAMHALDTGEYAVLNYRYVPRNEKHQLDVHRPYIDTIALDCDCGGAMHRVSEVMDVWFDSGCMPFAQDHYPFENEHYIDTKGYPADFIAEAIDQTRGWFYTLHAVGALLGRGRAYNNVISLGHLLDKNGKKMSKSVGNVVDPWEMMDTYGADALRLWMYSINQPGESKNFDEKTVDEIIKKVFNLVLNVLTFYELNREAAAQQHTTPQSPNVLDQWIVARTHQLTKEVTDHMDCYQLLEPVRAIREFIGDLSTWYVRRSRDRFKETDADGMHARQTLYWVLQTLSKLLAPFAPFVAEDMYQRLRKDGDPESVHLETWPYRKKTFQEIIFPWQQAKDRRVLSDMQKTRDIVSEALELRAQAGIKIRQPLSRLTLPPESRKLPDQFLQLIADEVNVHEVKYASGQTDKMDLDTELTEALKDEGRLRDLLRLLQQARKKAGLTQGQEGVVKTAGAEILQPFIKEHEDSIKEETTLTFSNEKPEGGDVVQWDGEEITIEVQKPPNP